MSRGIDDPSHASESALEERLRAALSGAAPEGHPTIGVREKIVGSVRARARRRQRVAGALAACCLVIAGASVGVASWHATQSSGNKDAAALAPSHKKLPLAPSAPGGRSSLARSNCGEIVEGSVEAAGCYGVYNRSPDLSINGTVLGLAPQGAPYASSRSTPAKSAGSGATSTHPTSTQEKALSGEGSYRVLVPVGQPVSVMLPGTTGEIWSAPAVAPGQGSGAAQVRIIHEQSGGVGEGSSASFESAAAVTVLIDASALPVCGDSHVACGAPVSTWALVLEFQKS